MPQLIQYYHVKPNTFFSVGISYYYPGQDYLVLPDVYNGKVDDGRNFADLCDSAVQETVSFGP